MVERPTLENLAEHIADPAGAKLTREEFAYVVERITFAFQHLDVKEARKAEFERITRKFSNRFSRGSERRNSLPW
jgi:hypothetical protein